MRLAVALFALAMLQVPAGAAPDPQSTSPSAPPTAQPAPDSQSSINPQSAVRNPQSETHTPQVIRIDVIAADAKGRALSNLKPADFELRDDGVPQPIESVRYVQPTDDTPRRIAIFLDEYHV